MDHSRNKKRYFLKDYIYDEHTNALQPELSLIRCDVQNSKGLKHNNGCLRGLRKFSLSFIHHDKIKGCKSSMQQPLPLMDMQKKRRLKIASVEQTLRLTKKLQ